VGSVQVRVKPFSVASVRKCVCVRVRLRACVNTERHRVRIERRTMTCHCAAVADAADAGEIAETENDELPM